MKKTNRLISSGSTTSDQPQQLMDLAGLELKRRRLVRDLRDVVLEMNQLNREIELLGIEIPRGALRP